jgi:hypothetical protein
MGERYPHIVDMGGCTLHNVHNAVRYAVEAFQRDVEDLLSEIYGHLKFSHVKQWEYT